MLPSALERRSEGPLWVGTGDFQSGLTQGPAHRRRPLADAAPAEAERAPSPASGGARSGDAGVGV